MSKYKKNKKTFITGADVRNAKDRSLSALNREKSNGDTEEKVWVKKNRLYEKILKLAINEKGIAQNRTEVETYNRTQMYKGIFPIVFSWSKNYTYIISEYVIPLDTLNGVYHDGKPADDFTECLGVDENTLHQIVHTISNYTKDSYISKDNNQIFIN